MKSSGLKIIENLAENLVETKGGIESESKRAIGFLVTCLASATFVLILAGILIFSLKGFVAKAIVLVISLLILKIIALLIAFRKTLFLSKLVLATTPSFSLLKQSQKQ